MKNRQHTLSVFKKLFGSAVLIALTVFIAGRASANTFASDVTILNDGYFYGKNMSQEAMTFVVETEGMVTSAQWQVANSKNGTYTDLEGITGAEVTFTPETDKWYRCCINGNLYTDALMALSGTTSTGTFTYFCSQAKWYLSNGTMGYSFCNQGMMDIVGYYEKEGNKYWLQTSYGGNGWVMSDTTVDSQIRFTFDKVNPVIVYCDIDLEGSNKFAIDCDTQLGNNTTSSNGNADGAALAARIEGGTLSQIEMVGASRFDECQESDAAIVILAPGCSTFWIGFYDDRQKYAFNTSNDSNFNNATFKGVENVVVEVNSTDSGMAISWEDVEDGKVHFQFSVGTAAAAGVSACAAVAKTSSTAVTVSDATSEQYYALFDLAGNMIRGWTNEVDENNEIVFKNLAADTEYIVKTTTKELYDSVSGRVEELNEEDFEETEVQTAVNPLQPEEGIAEDSYLAPSILAYDTMIVVKHANPDYVYKLLNESGRTTVRDYVEPDAEGYVEFTGLTPDTVYQLAAKSGDNEMSEWTEVKTLPAVEEPVVETDANSLTITNPQEGVYYAVYDSEGKFIAGWSKLVSGDKIKFSGLDQAKDYVVKAICETDHRLIEDEGAEPRCPKDVDGKTDIDIKAAAEEGGNKLRIVPTDDGCKLWYANPELEYAIIDKNNVVVKDFTAPNAEQFLRFEGLDSSTEYYIVARRGELTSEDSVAFTTLAEGDSLYGKIDYTKRDDVIIYAFDEQGGELENVYINMTQEKLVTNGFSYACYSINGGQKWKAGKLTDAELAKLFNSGFSLALGTKYDTKTKKLAEDATVVYFDKVSKRPISRSFKINYKTYSDVFGLTNGQWTLLWNGSAVEMTNIEIGIADSTGKKIGKDGYGIWPDVDGVWVPNSASTDKTTSYEYYYRTMATEVSGASKAKKIKVSGLLKAPKIKVDYKKESIKIPANYNVYFGTVTPDPVKDKILYDPNETIYEIFDPATATKYEDYYGKGLKKTTAAVTFSIAGYITEERNTILLWGNAKDTKPATAKQVIKLAARSKVSNKTLTVKEGKITDFPKTYEIYDDSKQKWSTTMPKITSDAVIKVRVKNQATGGKETNDNKATSYEGLLTVTWGVIDAKKGVEGITSARISAQ